MDVSIMGKWKAQPSDFHGITQYTGSFFRSEIIAECLIDRWIKNKEINLVFQAKYVFSAQKHVVLHISQGNFTSSEEEIQH